MFIFSLLFCCGTFYICQFKHFDMLIYLCTKWVVHVPVIVKASSGPRYVVGCRSKVDKEKLISGTRVVLDMTTLTIMRALPREVLNYLIRCFISRGIDCTHTLSFWCSICLFYFSTWWYAETFPADFTVYWFFFPLLSSGWSCCLQHASWGSWQC